MSLIDPSQEIIYEIFDGSDLHISTLFDLLKARKHNISNSESPSFSEHVDFVQNNPYRKWFLLSDRQGYFGSVYVTKQNTIGLNIDDLRLALYAESIIDKIKSTIKPLPPIISERAEGFSINVPSSNTNLISILENLNYKSAQITYKL
jgi:hypothetical protein